MDSINNISYNRADRLPFQAHYMLSSIFVECFFNSVKHLSKDKTLLRDVFQHMFLPEFFYVAYCNNKIISMASCTSEPSAIKFNVSEFHRVFGFISGSLKYRRLKKDMISTNSRFYTDKNIGRIEFVSTEPNYRKQGIATGLIRYILTDGGFQKYQLEVDRTNKDAYDIYSKLGFILIEEEIDSNYITMELTPPKPQAKIYP